MSARGYCTDCENWTETRNGRCSCGSGRVLTPPAGYRILGPNELDPVTVEQCAAVIETNTIFDTINGKELRPRIMGDQFALFYATAIRALPTGGER